MYQTTNILNTKLMAPRIHGVVQRPGLGRLPTEILQKRLTSVIAGAGYGKTTLAAQAVALCRVPAVWYRLDTSDGEFTTFLSYLIAGVGKKYPKFGDRMSEHVRFSEDFGTDPESALTVFINELEALADSDMIIALDDCHLVRDSEEIRFALEFLLNNLPHSVHLFLISRSDTDLPLSRLRAMREILEITEQDLIFTPDEVQQLFSQVFDIPLKNGNTRTLHRKTGGWVSGLILFYHALKGKSEAETETLLSEMQGSHRTFFSYLEENIYERLTQDEREFLVRTSILTKLDATFCKQFLDMENAADTLRSFEERHLFIFSLGAEEESYYYQHLFQDFLQTKLRSELNSDEIYALHEAAGQIHESNGENEEALEHYLASEKFDDACRILSRIGRKMIKDGRLRRIRSVLGCFPGRYLESNPWVQYLHAGSLELSGRLTPARDYFQKAVQGFRAIRSEKGENICLADLAMNYCQIGDYGKSEAIFSELLAREDMLPFLRAVALGKMIDIAYHLGKISASDAYTEMALAVLPEIEDESHRVAAQIWVDLHIGERHSMAGDLNEALSVLEPTREKLERWAQPRLLVTCYIFLSKVCFKLGLFDKGVETASMALELSDEKGFRDISHACLPLSLAANYRGQGRLDEAIRNAREGLRRLREMGSLTGQAYAFLELHNTYLAAGNLAAAEDKARDGLAVLEPLESSPLLTIYRELEAGLAILHIERGAFDQAVSYLQNSERTVWNSKWHEAKISCIYARLYLRQNMGEKAADQLERNLPICEKKQYDAMLMAEKGWIVPVLAEVYSRGKMKEYVRKILIKIGADAETELCALAGPGKSGLKKAATCLLGAIRKASAPELNVRFFGKFRVFAGENEILAKRWKSKKALMIFKYLVFRRSRGFLKKEMLMELIWPEEDPAKTAKRFHVALASLRKVLEPKILKGIPSSYLSSEGDAYTIHLGEGARVDADEFLRELGLAKKETNPEKVMAHYLNAELLYGGDFLEEDLYVGWCSDEREQFREDYLHTLSKIIAHFENTREYEKSIEYAGKYLRFDKYAEPVYQALMRCYSNSGNSAMVVRTFEKCKQNIMTELNCPLSRESLELYQHLGFN